MIDDKGNSVNEGKSTILRLDQRQEGNVSEEPELLKNIKLSLNNNGDPRTHSVKDKITLNTSSKNSYVKVLDLDDVLVNELGQFGKYQFFNLLLISILIILSAFTSEYVFVAASLPYRCYIPECDGSDPVYETSWILHAAVPETSSGFANCERYEPLTSPSAGAGSCPRTLFNQSSTISCESYVYEKTNSVVYDFGLECQEWLRVLAGTLSSVGTLLVLPITGFVSDRYGRRIALTINVFNLALFGLIRAFSINYPMYLAFQLLQTTFGAGTFSSAYIFASEFVGPKYRVLTTAVCSSMFAVGQVALGSIAWLIQPWRYLMIALYVPCFLLVSYYWILSESVRWLLSVKRYDEAKEVLEKVARVNKKQISEKSLFALTNPPMPIDKEFEHEHPKVLKTILSSKIILRRVCTTPLWWVTTTFVYYGLSINSTGLSGNMYLNYILTCAVEIPGNFCAVLVLDRIGRKPTISIGFFLSAACNIAFAFISNDLVTLRLVLFLFGKFGISIVFTSLYLFTSELYPTKYRHSLLGFSSMIGRIGSITAPLTPALMEYWEGIPSLMFGVMGLLAGVLVFTQPETLGTKMPDTLEEAEMIGIKTKE